MTTPSDQPPRLSGAYASTPGGRLLSNGRWTTVITGRGTGFAECAGRRLTGWRGDRVEDGDGVFVYVRETDTGAVYSVGCAPIPADAGAYDVHWMPGRVRLHRRERAIDLVMDVCVAPDADVELRRVTIANTGTVHRRLEVTTYAEVVLHDAAAHAAHPAFSKLFVQTDVDTSTGVLTAWRRPRGPAPEPLVLAHALLGPGSIEWETDRVRFLGRGRRLADPCGLGGRLSGTVGSVLDPVFALRRFVDLEPGEAATLTAVLACAPSPAAAAAAALRYGDESSVQDAFGRAARWARDLLATEALSPATGEYLQAIAVAMRYGAPELRADDRSLRRVFDSAAPASAGARPLVLCEPSAERMAAATASLESAGRYWAAHRLPCDTIVVGVTDLDGDALARARTAAALVLGDEWPRLSPPPDAPPPGVGCPIVPAPSATHVVVADDRGASSGWGAVVDGGRAYVIDVPAATGARPPMPWTNVLANPKLGCVVSESGAGCTWSRNSREHRLTPWSNDPVVDPHGEALYVRDEVTGAFWSPQPGPAGGGEPYRVEHGFGYSTWRHERDGLDHETTTFVAIDDAVRLTRVRLTNRGSAPRRLSVYAYAHLVLGVSPTDAPHAIVTRIDDDTSAVLASSGLRPAGLDGIVVAAVVGAGGAARSATCDRAAFLGPGGTPMAPAALRMPGLVSPSSGTRLDPCAALQVVLDLGPGEQGECTFLLADAETPGAARELVARYDAAGVVDAALDAVRQHWTRTLTAVQIATPSPAIDVMVNGWLAYQTLACRLWGRSAFYQSGGAFGFRDQLQDAAALVWARPDLTRAQVLVHAAHQFPEGDVLHWWHPPTERGTRTRFADDRLWLPYVTAFYVAATGDASVLDEEIGFVDARPLGDGEDEAYLDTHPAAETASVYAHCCRAIDRSLAVGAHGLPLMGTGDWNDGMNLVGRAGRGESVWMGFFLCAVLADFEPLAARRGDAERVERYAAHRRALADALERHAWDGRWYRRAWFDDGTVLGSASEAECRIDLLPQAWAVIARATDAARAAAAMDAAERELVLDPPGIVRLLAPPFDRTTHEPGYIKGYVPGIRENGGQYTHAALWAVRAMAELGRRDRAVALLEMLTPLRHTRDAAATAGYATEPYVVAADVYAAPQHLGRGGWTWYTGSSGWMLRVALESILGFTIENGSAIRLRPRVPDAWPSFTVTYRTPDGETCYELRVDNPSGRAEVVVAVSVDGVAVGPDGGSACVPIVRDGGRHHVRVTLGAASAAPPASNT